VHLKLVDEDSVEYKEGKNDILTPSALDQEVDPLRTAGLALTVKKLLKAGWKHTDRNTPKLQRIFKIMCPLDTLLPYLKHRCVEVTVWGNKSIVLTIATGRTYSQRPKPRREGQRMIRIVSNICYFTARQERVSWERTPLRQLYAHFRYVRYVAS
jgi:hypothetical protein